VFRVPVFALRTCPVHLRGEPYSEARASIPPNLLFSGLRSETAMQSCEERLKTFHR
jgi:hypothetical protein